ncbi:hypothetical protein SPH9361_04225 [Sphingobium sp. CECT 9361]|nr:hypothetical protein SPH9361_04225 [Sphingobium sp. CECT 9361]
MGRLGRARPGPCVIIAPYRLIHILRHDLTVAVRHRRKTQDVGNIQLSILHQARQHVFLLDHSDGLKLVTPFADAIVDHRLPALLVIDPEAEASDFHGKVRRSFCVERQHAIVRMLS